MKTPEKRENQEAVVWEYVRAVVDVVREPILMLDENLRVAVANESFYRTFQVEAADTEHKIVYELGNGQWNIPALRKLLEEILPRNTFFKGFEVAHEFPFIGRKVMILNARKINSRELFPPIILLAMEDISEMMVIADTLASRANHVEAKLIDRTQKLEAHLGTLEKEVSALKLNTSL